MPLPLPSQISGDQQFMHAIQEAISAGIRVAMPGTVVSFDEDAVTATVQPAIKGYETDSTGTRISISMPQLVDVPVSFPRGGGCTLTFPVKAGDECELIFNDRCIDFWWQSGGEQEPVHPRQHHVGDAIAFLGPMSQAKKISGISTSATQLRSDDGSTFFELNPSTQKIKIVAPGGMEIDTPLATFSNAVTIKGLLSWMGGMVGSIANGVAATITGAVNFIGTVKANGKVIDDTHTHGGVQRGDSDTNEVN